jgi:hypothetical protein
MGPGDNFQAPKEGMNARGEQNERGFKAETTEFSQNGQLGVQ